MKQKFQIGIFALLVATPGIAMAADSRCAPFLGAAIVSSDGKFLGRLSNKFDSESIFNKFGTYGSKFQTDSIWNKFGQYGNAYSNLSAFNPYTTDAPMVIKDKKVIAVLTKNKQLSGAVDPLILSVLCFDYTPE